uniref:4-keto-6-deoxy-N-acetyl-D-hexosaminyl-(Lipid carrier) aminotransferase n=1 Tax=uncultured bacterium F41-01 TaxID=1191437 RepID=I3VIR1_9BACT|nr:4-keto-6-deoxy-N-acetyl-D-hexosaminyl-(lipid carrier) aminotransferase [uncultured bacterium F41-01]
MVGKELAYIQQAVENMHLSGDGPFTHKCQAWLEERIGCQCALLTHSGTAALEMTALLADIQPGDEIIMPSFTFVSTANAFVLRGGVPVFVDIRPDTLCIDETKIEAAITSRTRAIVVVHYAGVSCEMDTICSLARQYRLMVIEDAAQGICAFYKGRPLGSLGTLAAVSFHETKNVIAGEGGALLINDQRWIDRAEIIREKGTNRKQFFRGQVDKYSWVDIGSSYLPSEINAAFLWAQLEEAETITQRRVAIWQQYHEAFADLEQREYLRRPIVPPACQHNAHLYYLLFPDLHTRMNVLEQLSKTGVNAVFHYIPLHSSAAGQQYGRSVGNLSQTNKASDCLLRLPLWIGMQEAEVSFVIEIVRALASQITSARGTSRRLTNLPS